MSRLIILSGVDDEGVKVDVSRAYASISSNAQCQVNSLWWLMVLSVFRGCAWSEKVVAK